MNLPPLLADRLTATPDGCWIWQAAVTSRGYGSVGYRGRVWSVHRLVYVLTRGPIPDDMTIDHLCHNKRCANPDHLEVVTRAENTRRAHRDGLVPGNGKQHRTHCRHGHEYTTENTYVAPDGSRTCRQCRRDSYNRMKETA